jgi:spoIIIJ-associated protein
MEKVSNIDPAEFESRLLAFTRHLFESMGFSLHCETATVEGMFFLNFSGRDIDELTANRSELLFAIEYLLNKIFQADVSQFGMVNCDVHGKKQLRVSELRLIAQTAATKVQETKLPFRLNPMDSRERRIVHLALADDNTIRTESEGEGEYRKVVIYPAAE